MEPKRTSGQAMREARHRLGWTQLDLARQVGCTESMVTKIETGRARPERELKEAIAQKLKIPTWVIGV